MGRLLARFWRSIFLKKSKVVYLGLGVVALGIAGFYVWLTGEVKPLDKPEKYIRITSSKRFSDLTPMLQEQGLIRNASAASLYLKLYKKDAKIEKGTYKINPKLQLDAIIRSMRSPMRNMFRIPETNLSFRTANLLEKSEIATAKEYNDLIKTPSEFASEVSFALPKDSLEGYLYPDTYDLPPLIGAKAVISRQLKNFEKKVLPLVPDDANRKKILTIASMVELEAAVPEDRSLIAGVIYNRLNKGMLLQIDATVLYALKEWRTLYNKDYRSTDSPYNTYIHKGLPPGPICSPTVASVKAALNPAKHNYFYYVAQPNKKHLFATTYGEHLKNIIKIRKMKESSPAKS